MAIFQKSFKKAITRDTLLIRCTTLYFTLLVKYTHDTQHCYLKKDWDVNDQHEDRQNIHDFFSLLQVMMMMMILK